MSTERVEKSAYLDIKEWCLGEAWAWNASESVDGAMIGTFHTDILNRTAS